MLYLAGAWNKGNTSNPVLAMGRVHENIMVFSKGEAKIKKSIIPYLEMKADNIQSILYDIKRLIGGLKNTDSLERVIKYIETGELDTEKQRTHIGITVSDSLKERDRCVVTYNAIHKGMVEQSIMRVNRDHYDTSHPTKKPVRLLERLIMICMGNEKGCHIADFFGGSFSTMLACHSLGHHGYSCEIDSELYDMGLNNFVDNGGCNISLF